MAFHLPVIMGLFFICGLSTVMNHLLIPYLQSVWQMSYTAIMSVQLSFYLGYFLGSPLTGFLIRGRFIHGMRIGAILGGLGAVMIALSSIQGSLILTLLSIFCVGSGIAMIQVCANPYVLQMRGESDLAIAQSATGIGMLLAPLIGARCLLANACEDLSIQSLLPPYMIIGSLWFFLAMMLFLLPKTKSEPQKRNPFQFNSVLILGFLGIALSVGVETTIASFIVKYLSDPQILGVSMETAGYLSMLYWFGLVAGRAIGGVLLLKRDSSSILRWHAMSGCLFTCLILFTSGFFAAAAILLLGFSVSMMFPLIFSHVIKNSGENAGQASGILCMANIGGAAIPFIQGIIADTATLHISFIIPFLCYFLLYQLGVQEYQKRAVNTI